MKKLLLSLCVVAMLSFSVRAEELILTIAENHLRYVPIITVEDVNGVNVKIYNTQGIKDYGQIGIDKLKAGGEGEKKYWQDMKADLALIDAEIAKAQAKIDLAIKLQAEIDKTVVE